MAKNNETKSVSLVNRTNYQKKVTEFALLKEQISVLESKSKPLGEAIKEYVKFTGTKTDTGGYISDLEEVVVEARSRQKIEFDQQKVIAVLINKPELLSQVVKAVTVIDEDVINKLYENGELTSEEVAQMATVTITHSLHVSKKEEMPEVAQTKTTLTAASTKRKLLPKKMAH